MKRHSNRFLAACMVLMCTFGASAAAHAETPQIDNWEVWQFEIAAQEDIDGDGHIGPPPKRDDAPMTDSAELH